MSPAGRPRKPLANLPAHIDAAKLPRGIYWDSERRCWYVREANKAGKTSRKRVADAAARMSDLHQLVEQRAGVDQASLRWLCTQFETSPEWRLLSPSSQGDYKYCRGVLCDWPTKAGKFGDLIAKGITRPVVQRLVYTIATGSNDKPTPSKAAHVRRYMSAVWEWALNSGHTTTPNPVTGTKSPAERKQRRLPDHTTMAAVITFAATRGSLGHGKEGSCAPYLWAVAEIAYTCRLRGIEVATLTEAAADKAGIRTNRRKGSRDNIAAWSPRMRAAWDFLITRRDAIWTKKKRPVPIRPDQRPLLVAIDGNPLTKSALDTAWQRLMLLAIEANIITPDQRYGLHDLKRRGITDTTGNRSDKQEASGHRSAGMLDTYDLSVPVVPAAGE
jgi:hypothetical protein